MGLDIRLPIGLMFTLLGPILVVTGVVNGTSLNTETGAAMLIFGVLMLALGVSAQKRVAEAVRSTPKAVHGIASSAPSGRPAIH